MDKPLAELAAYFQSKSRLPDHALVQLTEAARATGSRWEDIAAACGIQTYQDLAGVVYRITGETGADLLFSTTQYAVEQLTGSQRRWLGYLHEVVELIGRDPEAGGDGFDTLSRARGRAIAVIANHHNLLLALPGPGAGLTASDRARLDALTGPRPLQGAR